ncbi:RND family transporter [Mycobacterium vicinigordonae]|uniref:RND family transporter n=1 Tax=Mycobacterium vicinigordonae TaxID=1719132 RepID=A0A7D6EAB4_9MYCO|nr:RND family transporter [Mycobacterium vicinigordonae]QLL08545.1 RND family transporter [Mycobacterium vicinigordonae]
MSLHRTSERRGLAGFVLRFSVPVILAWLLLTVLVNVFVPQLEAVGKEHSVSLASRSSQSYRALKRQGELFDQFNSDSIAMVLLESDTALGPAARDYYRGLVDRLKRDTAHVQHVQDFWGDRITAGGAQSADGKAAYVQINLVGDQGTTTGKDSVAAVRGIVDRDPPPRGLRVYVTGQAALTADMNNAGDKSLTKMTLITLAVITIVLLLIYRSISTVLLILAVVFVELGAARGVVAFLGQQNLFGLSVFAVSLITSLAIAAGTDYVIFFLGRYQEARAAGQDRTTAYFTTYRSVSHVVLASGLTIAGATLCLSFTRLPYLQTLGVPCFIGMLVVVAAALTATPAVLLVATRFGLMESTRVVSNRRWRRIGTAIVRWPGPILAVTCIAALVGLAVLPTYSVSYNERYYVPDRLPSIKALEVSDAHFSKARMNPDIFVIEAKHDLRTPANMLVLDKVARAIFRLHGINKVQSITRPLGAPIDHSSVPFQVSAQAIPLNENMQFLKERMGDMHKMIDDIGRMIAILEQTHGIMTDLSNINHVTLDDTKAMQATTAKMRDEFADFDDEFRPIRNYFYWEKHCFDIPMCWGIRQLFDSLDNLDVLAENMQTMNGHFEQLDTTLRKVNEQLPPMIAVATTVRDTMLTMYSSYDGFVNQMDRMVDTASVMGRAFDEAKNDDLFYLPPEAFGNEDFKKGMALMLSPDGKTAQMIITHKGDPASNTALATTDAELDAAQEALKGTPLDDSSVYLAGTAPTYHDIAEAVKYDLMIAVVAALSLILIIMLVVTRAVVASCVIVGTIVVSLGSSFGLSVLIWQYILGLPLHWMVMPFTVIALLAVGSDYNLLLVSRLQEELGAGLNTAIIRGVAGSGKVVTAAGLVFAFTMGSMISSDLTAIGQVGTSICLGLLFDTLVVRAFMTPAAAALLGRWFWWPMRVDKYAARARRRANSARELVPV